MNAFSFLIFTYLFKMFFSNNEHTVFVKKYYVYLKIFRFSCLPSSSLFLVLGTRDRQHSLNLHLTSFSSVQLLSRVQIFATPWTTARQDSLSITNSQSLPKLMSIESVMPSNHLILCHPLPPALNLSQHQGLFKWVSSLHEVAKVLECQLQHQSFQWIFRTDLL